jgi:alpha-galactosidase
MTETAPRTRGVGAATGNAVTAVTHWVRRVWAGERVPPGGMPWYEGWWATDLPFSFVYDGTPSAQLLPRWGRRQEMVQEAGRTVWRVDLADPRTGLEVTWEATTYADPPAVEWLVTFQHGGTTRTPLLEQVRALDLVLATDYHDLLLYHATGGIAAPDAFQPHQTLLPRSGAFKLASTGGRSSNGVLPYFNVEATWDGYRGVVVAIGWTGQWEAQVTRFRSRPPLVVEPDLRGPNPQVSAFRSLDRVRLEAGMEGVHLVLEPGERIRTPRILLLPWAGDRWQGHNRLRRFIYRHVAPHLSGAPPLPPISCNLGIVDPDSGALGAGYRYLDLASQAAALDVDAVVIDAGWFTVPPLPDVRPEARWAQGVGNYTVRRDVFPEGLRPIAQAVRRAGKGFGLWFEPERVYEGTEVFTEHREFLYPTPLPNTRSYVFNLGNPVARRWLVDTISRLIDEMGIDWYRHDANADYLPVWRAHDPPDRQGMSEIRHIEGLYQFWRELRARHPGLYLEGCASGGRRMDYEALRYHHSYFFTDWMVGDPAGMQSIVHGASHWLPGIYMNNVMGQTAAATEDTPEQRYGFWSAAGGGLMYGWRVFNARQPIDLELARRWIGEFRALRHLAVGDFYPLLPHTNSEGEWLASQYDRPDLGEGMIVAFRRRHCPVDTVLLRPRGLDPAAAYVLEYQSTGKRLERRGRDLIAGLMLTLSHAPSHELIHYRRTRE